MGDEADKSELGKFANLALAIIAVTALVSTIVLGLPALGYHSFANFVIVILVGFGTGATELLSRFRDQPFQAVISKPGMFYLAVNGGAAALAFFLMLEWKILNEADEKAQQVLVAGLSAMAFLRTGLFTTKVGDKEIAFGPSLVLQVVLDALDREYDRQRAYRRAGIIEKVMGGLDFKTARTSLPEICFSLMQNVRAEEKERFATDLQHLVQLEGLSDEARSMALGLMLMQIVGEDTLEAAGKSLGSAILKFDPISDEIKKALAVPSVEDVNESLLAVCNRVSHRRAKLTDGRIGELKDEIAAISSLEAMPRAMLMCYEARRLYGKAALLAALNILPPEESPPPPPPPPEPDELQGNEAGPPGELPDPAPDD